MSLENRKAETGIYAVKGTYEWTADGTATTGPALLPAFTPQGNSKMNYEVKITGAGLIYELTVTDPSIGSGVTAYKTDQSGKEIERLK